MTKCVTTAQAAMSAAQNALVQKESELEIQLGLDKASRPPTHTHERTHRTAPHCTAPHRTAPHRTHTALRQHEEDRYART
jgi:hypothetical protein